MKEYERNRQEREHRLNCARLARALYEYISGSYAGADRPTVQRLASMLHYMPEQLVTDTQDMYAAITDSFNYGELLDRITARYNSETDQTEERSAGEILGLIISEYALKHYPELMNDDDY